jgi:hypothetical protein
MAQEPNSNIDTVDLASGERAQGARAFDGHTREGTTSPASSNEAELVLTGGHESPLYDLNIPTESEAHEKREAAKAAMAKHKCRVAPETRQESSSSATVQAKPAHPQSEDSVMTEGTAGKTAVEPRAHTPLEEVDMTAEAVAATTASFSGEIAMGTKPNHRYMMQVRPELDPVNIATLQSHFAGGMSRLEDVSTTPPSTKEFIARMKAKIRRYITLYR